MPKLNVNADLIRQMAEILRDTDLTEIEYGEGETHLRVARQVQVQTTVAAPIAAAPIAAAAAPAAASAAAPASSAADHPGVVTSPMVGVAYTSAEPGAPLFVNVGDDVKEGDVILLLEAMKVFNQIKAPRSGKVVQVLVESGSPVEFGEPLMIIE